MTKQMTLDRRQFIGTSTGLVAGATSTGLTLGLMLPGTMFQPASHPEGARQLRIAFANIDATGIAEMFRRLALLRP